MVAFSHIFFRGGEKDIMRHVTWVRSNRLRERKKEYLFGDYLTSYNSVLPRARLLHEYIGLFSLPVLA